MIVPRHIGGSFVIGSPWSIAGIPVVDDAGAPVDITGWTLFGTLSVPGPKGGTVDPPLEVSFANGVISLGLTDTSAILPDRYIAQAFCVDASKLLHCLARGVVVAGAS